MCIIEIVVGSVSSITLVHMCISETRCFFFITIYGYEKEKLLKPTLGNGLDKDDQSNRLQ